MRAGQRRTRASLPNSQAGIEDISYLNLGEVRNRLERNERVLNTSLFSTSPPPARGAYSLSSSPTSPFRSPNAAVNVNPLTAGNPLNGGGGGQNDPFREKLLLARQALLEREKELLMEQEMSKMEMDPTMANQQQQQQQNGESSLDGRRRSSGYSGLGISGAVNRNSGKARAMEEIQAREVNLHPNGIILAYAETLALGERDYDNATINQISKISLADPPRPKYDPQDEIARAQANARMTRFMGYKPTSDDLEGEGEDGILGEGEEGGEGEGMFEEDWTAEGEYDGQDDRFELHPQGREVRKKEKGTGEDVDNQGEDDEEWAEGNDDYLERVR